MIMLGILTRLSVGKLDALGFEVKFGYSGYFLYRHEYFYGPGTLMNICFTLKIMLALSLMLIMKVHHSCGIKDWGVFQRRD